MKPKRCDICTHPLLRDQRLLMNPRSLIENCECTCIDKRICHRCFEKLTPVEDTGIYQCPYCRNNITNFIIKYFKQSIHHTESDIYVTLSTFMFLEQIPLLRLKKVEEKVYECVTGTLSMDSINCMSMFSETERQIIDFYLPLVSLVHTIDSKITFGMFMEQYPKVRPLMFEYHRQTYLTHKLNVRLLFHKNAILENNITFVRRLNNVQ